MMCVDTHHNEDDMPLPTQPGWPLQTSTLNACGIRSRVLQAGSDPQATEAVVFVHGNPGSADDWRDVMHAVSPLARVVAVDMPGFGKADKPANYPYSVEGGAAFLAEALKQLGVVRAHLVLHDFGGPWGLMWAAMNPVGVASLTLVNTGVLKGYRWHLMARIWRTPTRCGLRRFNHRLRASARGGHACQLRCAPGRSEGQDATDNARYVAHAKPGWNSVLISVNGRAKDEIAVLVLTNTDAGEVGLNDLYSLRRRRHERSEAGLRACDAELIQLGHAGPLGQRVGFRGSSFGSSNKLDSGCRQLFDSINHALFRDGYTLAPDVGERLVGKVGSAACLDLVLNHEQN
jgi:pimeloyl-ACP methyl ester carboxylesterase